MGCGGVLRHVLREDTQHIPPAFLPLLPFLLLLSGWRAEGDGASLPEAARAAMAALVRAVVSGNGGGRHRRPPLTRRPPPRPSPRHGGALRGLSGPCGPSAVLRPHRSGAARLAALTRGEEGAGSGWGGFLWVCASIGALQGFRVLGLGFIFEDLLFFSSEGSPFWRSLSHFRGVIKVPISVSVGGDWVPVNESRLLISSFVSHPCVYFWSVGFWNLSSRLPDFSFASRGWCQDLIPCPSADTGMASAASWRPMLEENGKPLIRELTQLIHLSFRTNVSGCGFAGMMSPALSSVQLKAAESKSA